VILREVNPARNALNYDQPVRTPALQPEELAFPAKYAEMHGAGASAAMDQRWSIK
jgi:hypothetical protein